MKHKRKKIWIDRFQTILSLRIAWYCVLYQAAVWSLVVLERSIAIAAERLLGPEGATSFFLLMAFGVVVLGFLGIYDAVKLSHRIVGPIYRIRKAIQAVAAGEELEPIQLRQGDYLQELKDDFNEMLKALEQRGAVVFKTAEAKQDRSQPVPAGTA